MSDFPGGDRNAAIFEMTRRATEGRAMAALAAVFKLMPIGKKVNLPNGEVGKIKVFFEPRLRDHEPNAGKASFGFDVQAIDGSWHLEFTVTNTGWGGRASHVDGPNRNPASRVISI